MSDSDKNNAHWKVERQAAELAAYDKVLEAFKSLNTFSDPGGPGFSKLELALTVLMRGGGDIAAVQKLNQDLFNNSAFMNGMLGSPEEIKRQVGCYAIVAHAYLIAQGKEFDQLSPNEITILKGIAMELGKDKEGMGGSVGLKYITESSIKSAFETALEKIKQSEPAKIPQEKSAETPGAGKPDTSLVKTATSSLFGGGGKST